MSWQHWIVVGWVGLKAIAAILLIGEDREPITAQVAAVNLIIAGLLIWAVVAG
jgi:hypothetical protein